MVQKLRMLYNNVAVVRQVASEYRRRRNRCVIRKSDMQRLQSLAKKDDLYEGATVEIFYASRERLNMRFTRHNLCRFQICSDILAIVSRDDR